MGEVGDVKRGLNYAIGSHLLHAVLKDVVITVPAQAVNSVLSAKTVLVPLVVQDAWSGTDT